MDNYMNTLISHIKHCNSVSSDEKLDEVAQPNIHVSTNIYNQAEGSSCVHFNNTIVTCGLKVKVHINQNINHYKTLNEGFLVCNVELTPLCSKNIQPGLPGEESQYLSEQMQSILSNNGPDLSKLVIKENKAVYVLYFDFIVLNHSGNLLDACLLAANSVLLSAKFPKVTWNTEIDNAMILNDDDLMEIPIKKLMYSITYGLIDSKILTNVEEELESCLKDDLDFVSIFVNEDGKCMLPTVTGCLNETKRNVLRAKMTQAVERVKILKEIVSNSCK